MGNMAHRPFFASPMRRLLIAILSLFCCFAAAGQTKDTVYLKDIIPQTVSDDELLLQMVANQSRQIRMRDSLRLDSIYNDLLEREVMLTEALAILRDSIAVMRPNMPVEKKRIEDSIMHKRDSVARVLVHEASNRRYLIEPSIIPDLQEDMADIRRAIRYEQSPWRKEAVTMLQFSQNYISPNWYKGGNSSIAVLALMKGQINYQKDKISWDNMGEWRVGATTVTGDSLRSYNFTDDLFRIYTKFGYQVYKNLSVATSADFQTNFFNIWTANKPKVKSSFLTPIKFNLTLGIDYKPVKNLSIMVSPLAYKMVYAYHGDSVLGTDVTNYGIKAGHRMLNEIGSSMRVQYVWQPLREIALDTEFYFYTNYHRVELDWEVNCQFIINRFLSARVTLHPRFDNTVKSSDSKAHLQFKELLSIGFAHRFH